MRRSQTDSNKGTIAWSGINGGLFDTLRGEALFLVVVKPISTLMHSGDSEGHKTAGYRELTPGQQAAFMFWVLYSHAPTCPSFTPGCPTCGIRSQLTGSS